VTTINAVCNKCNQIGLRTVPTFVSSNQQRQNDMKVEQIFYPAVKLRHNSLSS
jgi:hypothetical protein